MHFAAYPTCLAFFGQKANLTSHLLSCPIKLKVLKKLLIYMQIKSTMIQMFYQSNFFSIIYFDVPLPAFITHLQSGKQHFVGT